MERSKFFVSVEVLVSFLLIVVIGLIIRPYYLSMLEEAQYTVVVSTAGALNAAVHLQGVSPAPVDNCQQFFNEALNETGLKATEDCQLQPGGLKKEAFCVLESKEAQLPQKCVYAYFQNKQLAIEYEPGTHKIAIVRRGV